MTGSSKTELYYVKLAFNVPHVVNLKIQAASLDEAIHEICTVFEAADREENPESVALHEAQLLRMNGSIHRQIISITPNHQPNITDEFIDLPNKGYALPKIEDEEAEILINALQMMMLADPTDRTRKLLDNLCRQKKFFTEGKLT
jgi:hypothetical protein